MRTLFGFVLPWIVCSVANAAITDLSTWTLVEDPPNANFSAAQTAVNATLSAAGPVPAGVDIGFQSVSGDTVSNSTAGHYFDTNSDFSIAIDYDWTFNSASGFLGLGFGIGEDSDGMNSAGVAMATSNGSPFLTFGGAARVNDADQAPLVLGATTSSLSGSLFVSYEAASGDILLGAATSTGAAAPTVTGTYSGIQNQWNDEALLASFFIRSDGPAGGQWLGGDADAVFSNFRILSGSAVAVPEPSAVGVIALFGTTLAMRRRR
ncbi:MAG: hypothetical protein AAFX06_18385 [Planctomycetota bacterium]